MATADAPSTHGSSPQAPEAPAPRKRRRWRRWVLLSFVLLLIAGEVVSRVLVDRSSRFNIFTGAAKEWDPERRVRLRRNYHSGEIHINSKGTMGPEFEAQKPPGGFRVAVLGDSCGFIPARRNYPRVLEELLRNAHPGRTIEVINASCPAYDSRQTRLWYEKEIDGYEHDQLILYVGWNDIGQFNPDGLAFKLDETGYLKEPTLFQKALLNCYLLRGMYFALGYFERERPFSNEPLSAEDAARYESFYPQHYEDNLRATIVLARSRGRQVFLLNFASLVNETPTADEQRRMHFPRGMGRNLPKYLSVIGTYKRVFHKVAAETGTAVIDIESLFSTPEERRAFTDSMHFNVEGAERIAAKIAAELEPFVK